MYRQRIQIFLRPLPAPINKMLYKSLTEGAALEITPVQVRQQIAVIEECHRQNPMPKLT